MKRFLLMFNFHGDWSVYHEADGNYRLCEDDVEIVCPMLEENEFSYFVFDIDGLCDPDVVSLHDVTYDWR